jgi:hypothetical protein
VLNGLRKSFAFRITLVQFFFILACAFFSFYSLTNWDGEWYRQLVDIGYSTIHSADRFAEGKGNVGFFPGYPLLSFIVKKVLGFGTDAFPTTGALLITSNVCALFTWVLLEKWLNLFRTSQPRIKMVMLALFPFAMFLYVAYTESLFAVATLGFFYFSEKFNREDDQRKSRRDLFLAALFGFMMNLTRLLGIVLVVYPLIRAFQTGEKKKRAFFIAAGSLTSPILFFIYCQIKFGAWDLYFQTERAIWGTYIDFHKLFPPKTLFDFSRPFHPNTLCRYVTIITGVGLTYKLAKLIKEKAWSSPDLAVVLCSGMMWGEYLLGRTTWDYAGMGRMLLPVFMIMLPFIKIEPKRNWRWIVFASVMLGFQIAYALRFGRHGWVA